MKSIISGILKGYLYSLFIIAACYHDNGYFNIIGAKAYICRLLLLIFVPIVICCLIVSFIEFLIKKTKTAESPLVRKRCLAERFCLTDIAIVFFIITAVISAFSSDSPTHAILGDSGWGCGALLFILLGIMYFCISRYIDIRDEYTLTPVIIGGIIIFGWAIINYFGIDIDSMHEGFYNESTVRFYLSGIGNVNNIAAYISMLIPLAVMAFSGSESIVCRIMLGVFLFMGGFCSVIIVADSVYLGLGVAAVAIVFYSLGNFRLIRDICLPLAVFFGGAAVVAVPNKLLPGITNLIDGLSASMLNNYVFAACALFFFGLHFLLYYSKKTWLPKYFTRISRAVFCIITLIAVIMYIKSVSDKFDDSWGSQRGFIWTRTVALFASLPLVQKLFGVGIDCFKIVFHKAYDSEIIKVFGMTVSNAHNEPLQYLVTTGVFGLLSYLFMYLCSFLDVIKRKERPPLSVAAFFGIVGYAGQALVNNPHAFNCSILFFLFAVFAAGSFKRNDKVQAMMDSEDDTATVLSDNTVQASTPVSAN